MAVTGDLILHTLLGPLTVERAAIHGEPFLCFTYRDGHITVGKVLVWPEPRLAEVNTIFLDDGTTFRATSDQEVVRRDGGSAVLTPPLELSCMPLYHGHTTNGYPTYRQVGTRHKKYPAPCDRRRYRLVSRMVYEWKSGEQIPMGMKVCHRDGNKANTHPDNLYLDGRPQKKGRRRKAANKLMMLRASQILKLRDNHRILAVKRFGEEAVYDLDTALPGCFNVGAGGIFLVTKDDRHGTP